MKKNVDILSGSITRGLLSLAIPIMIMNVAQSLFNLMDMAVLRFYADDTAVGAVGACGSIFTLCTCLLVGVSAGATVVIARRIGAGEKENAEKATMTAILFAIISGCVLMLIGVVFAEDFLRFTNCPEKLLPSAVSYFKIYFYGIPILMLYNFCAAILRAMGDTKRPMYFLICGAAIKLLFTILLIKTLKKGVESVAIATIISNAVACALTFLALTHKKDIVHIKLKKLRFNGKELKAILYNGVPAGFQSGLYSFANVIIATVVNSFGPDATTGIAIANQYDGILYQISCATALAVIPYVSQNMGAGNIKRVKQTIGRGIMLTVCFGATLGALSAIFSRQLSGLVSASPAVIEYSHQKMVLVSSTYFICGINELLGGVMKGMGKPIAPAMTSLVFMCLIRFVWVYVIFPLVPNNLTFLYLIWPIGWVLSISTLFIVYRITMSRIEKNHSIA